MSEDGQIVIPEPLRERLGIRAGQVLECREEHGRLVAAKADDMDPVEKVYGILNSQGSTDKWIEEPRGKPDACGLINERLITLPWSTA